MYEATHGLISAPELGHGVTAALGTRRVVLLRNHGVLVADKDIGWAVLTAVTLERAIRLQVTARALGSPRPYSQTTADELFPEKYRDVFVEESILGRMGALMRARVAALNTAYFRVNGQLTSANVRHEELLLDFLRDRRGSTGAAPLDVGVCGACTVLVDGAPVSACCYLAGELDGRDVLTH